MIDFAKLCRLVIVSTLIAVAAVPAAQAIEFGNFHALVIGNNAYKHLPKLETAVRDAKDVSGVLRARYGFKVTLLLNADRATTVKAINKLRANLRDRDNLLIYYAGHGVLDDETDTGFWLPTDAEKSNESNWLAISTLTRNLRAMSARHVMVVADSCYSGVLLRAADTDLATGIDRSVWLNRANQKRSRTALVSGGLEPVVDGGGGKNSVFAKAFLTALKTNDQVLDGQGLFARVRGPVVANARQTPQYSDIRLAGHDGGEFLFVPRIRRNAQAPAKGGGTQERDIELAFWNSVKDSADPDMLQTYLNRYPNGIFADLARLKMRKADRKAAPKPPKPSEKKAAKSVAPPKKRIEPPKTDLAFARPPNVSARWWGEELLCGTANDGSNVYLSLDLHVDNGKYEAAVTQAVIDIAPEIHVIKGEITNGMILIASAHFFEATLNPQLLRQDRFQLTVRGAHGGCTLSLLKRGF